jgi:CBS domain-containing protein
VQLDFYREFSQDPNAPSERVARELDAERESAAEMVAARLAGQHVRDAMIASVLTVDADAPVRDVARALVEHHVHRLVVTEGERPVGIVSSLDLARQVAEGRLG